MLNPLFISNDFLGWDTSEKIAVVTRLMDAYTVGGLVDLFQEAQRHGFPRQISADCVQIALSNLQSTSLHSPSNAIATMAYKFPAEKVFSFAMGLFKKMLGMLPGGSFLSGALGLFEILLGPLLFHQDKQNQMTEFMKQLLEGITEILHQDEAGTQYAYVDHWNTYLLKDVSLLL